MVQHNFAPGLHPQKSRHTLMLRSLGLLGGLSLMSNMGLAQAQAPELVDSAPTTQATEVPPVPAYSGSTAPVPPVPAAPESFPTEFAPVPAVPPIPAAPTDLLPSAPPPAAPATSSYDAPATIEFSERSTGCRAVVASGQVPGSVCGNLATQSGGNLSAGSYSPNGRSLAGLPSGPAASVHIGPLSVPTSVAFPENLPSLKDYYRRTLRPPAKLGNGNIRLMFPLSIPAPISSLFGWRLHPITGDARFHMGTDLAAPMGTPVLAAYAGQVAMADFLGGYGLSVALDHNKGTQQTLYAHLSEVFVKAGDQVKQGDVIGRVGSTGNSTGPHLHFEFRQLTPDGWVALDAGAQLEYALAQLVSSMEIAQAKSAPTQVNAGVRGVIQSEQIQ